MIDPAQGARIYPALHLAEMRDQVKFLGILGLMTVGLCNCALAQMTKKQLFVFEGSDWCAKCIRLNHEVLSDSSFSIFAQKEGIDVIHVDFPQRKKLSRDEQTANAGLAEKFGFQGTYPTMILTDGGARNANIPTDGDAVRTAAMISEILARWH